MVLHLTHLLNLPGVIIDSWDSDDNSVYFHLNILAEGMKCHHCNSYTEELHQIRPIIVRDLPAFGKNVYLKVPRRQFYCRICQRYITERLAFIDWRRKYTQRYEENIYYQVNNSNIEQVAQQENLSIEDVKSIVNHVCKKREKVKNIS